MTLRKPKPKTKRGAKVSSYRAAASGPMPQIIARIPQRGRTGAQWGDAITDQLFELSALSKGSVEQFRRVLIGESSEMPSEAEEKLDPVILRQAETLGWRLTASPLVQLRMSEWDYQSNGPQKFKRLGEAFRRAARTFQRKKLPPVDDPDLYVHKRAAVAELRRLQRFMRAKFSARLMKPRSEELRKVFSETLLRGEPNAFPYLRCNLEHWLAFFAENEKVLDAFALEGRIFPAGLFDLWIAWCKGFDPESLRQRISKLAKVSRS